MQYRNEKSRTFVSLLVKVAAAQFLMLVVMDLLFPFYANKMLSLYSNIPFVEYSDLRNGLSLITGPIRSGFSELRGALF